LIVWEAAEDRVDALKVLPHFFELEQVRLGGLDVTVGLGDEFDGEGRVVGIERGFGLDC
jgi:hypothetical protein